MNPNLSLLHPYPFQKLRELFLGVVPNPDLKPVNLSIGEPKHATPTLVTEALTANLGGLAQYPATQGSEALRQAAARWLSRRYGLRGLDIQREILPVNGSREALFAFVQAVVNASGAEKPVVISPNPFYQIYEGAALLAGAEPYYLNCLADQRFQPDWASVPAEVWARTQLVFVCSPGNPTGSVMSLNDWQDLFELSDRYGFVIASDECYSEIYFDAPPLGGLEAAATLGRDDFANLVMFTSLSKRSNVPGMRSGFVAGDARVLEKFLLYRTYHGSAMSPAIQAASVAAWDDEAHVEHNRQFLSVGESARRRRRICPRALPRAARHRAARQLSGARRPRRQPRRRLYPHCPGGSAGRVPGGCRAAGDICPQPRLTPDGAALPGAVIVLSFAL